MRYTIWRACELLKILPPDCQASWDTNNVWSQCSIFAYGQLRQVEDAGNDKT